MPDFNDAQRDLEWLADKFYNDDTDDLDNETISDICYDGYLSIRHLQEQLDEAQMIAADHESRANQEAEEKRIAMYEAENNTL